MIGIILVWDDMARSLESGDRVQSEISVVYKRWQVLFKFDLWGVFFGWVACCAF